MRTLAFAQSLSQSSFPDRNSRSNRWSSRKSSSSGRSSSNSSSRSNSSSSTRSVDILVPTRSWPRAFLNPLSCRRPDSPAPPRSRLLQSGATKATPRRSRCCFQTHQLLRAALALVAQAQGDSDAFDARRACEAWEAALAAGLVEVRAALAAKVIAASATGAAREVRSAEPDAAWACRRSGHLCGHGLRALSARAHVASRRLRLLRAGVCGYSLLACGRGLRSFAAA